MVHGDEENSARKSIFTARFFAVTQIVINGILVAGFVLYCIFSVILLIGISEVRFRWSPFRLLLTEMFFLSEKFGVFRAVPLSRHVFLVRVVGVRRHWHPASASRHVQELFDLRPQILSFVVHLFAVQEIRRMSADLLQLHFLGAKHANKQSIDPAGAAR